MKKLSFAARSKAACPPCLKAVGVLFCIALAMAGALALSSCAHTQPGLQREQDLYAATTNVVAVVADVANNLPAPYGSLFKGLVVGSGLLLGVWLHNLEKRLKALAAGGGSPDTPGPPSLGASAAVPAAPKT